MGEAIKTRRGIQKDSGNMWLYKEGNEYIDNSGGWVAVKEGANAAAASCVKNATNLVAATTAVGNGQYAEWFTIKQVDLARFKTLKARVTITSSNGNLVFHLGVNNSQSYATGTKPAILSVTTVGTDVIYSLDITSLTSADFIMLDATGGLQGAIYYQTTIYIWEVWLEE
jgi:hypothetical protein